MSGNSDNSPWNSFMENYEWEDENEDRLWYCPHGKAYAIRCKPCEADDSD